MSNKTAVDLLVDSLPLRIQNMYASEIENAKAMEKEQIIDARVSGFASSAEGWNGEVPCMKWSEMVRETKCEEYYKATYGK